jgi:hypothetical protein
MHKEPKPTDWYTIPSKDADRVKELEDGSLVFRHRSRYRFKALPGQWRKLRSVGYVVQYSVLYSEWERLRPSRLP